MVTKDVHTEHCCYLHGCKYMGEDDCPVAAGEKPQSYACEQCYFELYEAGDWELAHLINDMITREREQRIRELWEIMEGSCWCHMDYGSQCDNQSHDIAQNALRELLGPEWHRLCLQRFVTDPVRRKSLGF